MHVTLLIGQRAGQIVDLPSHAAQNLLTTGQAQQPTEAEIAAATEANRVAMQPKGAPDADEPGTVIHEVKHGAGDGRKIVAAGAGKYNVLGIDGTKLNDEPLARSEALLLAAALKPGGKPARPEGEEEAPAAAADETSPGSKDGAPSGKHKAKRG